ncbi:MAG: hypothetical protein ACRDVE_19470 [Actinocrinis sp.]
MDLSAFFGVVSTVDFALLGLWWVTVQSRPDLRRREAEAGRMAYLVSLQFVVPGTAALLAQVAPDVSAVWRISFALAGITGVLAIALFIPTLRAAGSPSVANVLAFGAIPLYLALIAVSATAWLFQANAQLKPLQVEGIFFCVITLLGAQVAWAVAMSPEIGQPPNQTPGQLPVQMPVQVPGQSQVQPQSRGYGSERFDPR